MSEPWVVRLTCTSSGTGRHVALTPEQRRALVERASACRLALGLEISHASVQPWLLDRERLLNLYNELCEVDRVICAEFEWPSPR